MSPHSRGMLNAHIKPDSAAGKMTAAEIVDKKGFGARWMFKPRMVDKFLAEGLPHLKIGSRRVRIVVAEGDAWMIQRYGCQRAAA